MGEAVIETPILLGMLFALVLCWSLQSLWRATFGPFLHWLANLGISVNKGFVHLNVHPFRYAEHLNTAVQKTLEQGIAMAEKRSVQALNAVVEPFLLIAGVTLALGLVSYEGFQALWHHVTTVTPRIIHQTIVRPVERAQKATAAISRATFNTLAHKVTALQAQVKALAHAIPHAIPQVIPRLGRLERTAIDYTKLHKWLKRALLGTLGATAVLAGLKALRLGFLRCTGFTKAGKRACGMDPNLLESLLADTLLIVGTLSLVEFAKEMQTVTEEVAPLVTRFWRDS